MTQAIEKTIDRETWHRAIRMIHIVLAAAVLLSVILAIEPAVAGAQDFEETTVVPRAQAVNGGVELVAEAKLLPDASAVDGTALWIAIDNRSNRPVRIRHQRLALHSPLGVYNARPMPAGTAIEALPDGIVAQGGQAAGFVQFESLPPELGSVDLEAELEDAESGESLGPVRLSLGFGEC